MTADNRVAKRVADGLGVVPRRQRHLHSKAPSADRKWLRALGGPQPQLRRRVHPGGTVDREQADDSCRAMATILRADPNGPCPVSQESPYHPVKDQPLSLRACALPEDRIEKLAAWLLEAFADRHHNDPISLTSTPPS